MSAAASSASPQRVEGEEALPALTQAAGPNGCLYSSVGCGKSLHV